MAISWSVKCLCTAQPCCSAIVVRVLNLFEIEVVTQREKRERNQRNEKPPGLNLEFFDEIFFV